MLRSRLLKAGSIRTRSVFDLCNYSNNFIIMMQIKASDVHEGADEKKQAKKKQHDN